MRKYYSMVRFSEKTVMPSNAIMKDVKAGPGVKVYRDMDTDLMTVVIEFPGAKSEYPWAKVEFARRLAEPEAETAPAKKGKG